MALKRMSRPRSKRLKAYALASATPKPRRPRLRARARPPRPRLRAPLAAKDETAALQTELSAVTLDAARTQAEHEGQIATLTVTVSGLEAKIQNGSKVIKNLKAEIERRKQGLHEDQNVIKRQSSKITRMEGELDFAEAQRLDLVSQRDALHGKLEALRLRTKTSVPSLKRPPVSSRPKTRRWWGSKASSPAPRPRPPPCNAACGRATRGSQCGARARQANKELRSSVKALKTANKQEAAKSQRLESKLEQALLKAADAQAQS